MAEFEVATVGDNCIDRFMPPVGLSAIGGNAVNVAVHLRKHGLKTAYFGAVGPDADGNRMLDCFGENGLVVDHIQMRDGVTAYTEIEFDQGGDRIFAFEEFGVCRGYRPTEEEVQILFRMRHVHIGWFDDGGVLRRRLHAAGVSVSQDITVNPGAEGLAIAFASAGSEPGAAIELARQLITEGAALAVVTRGAQGSLVTDGNVVAETGIRPVEVSDTTGAGDTFIAGFIAAHLKGKPHQECLEAGRDAAAVTCTHFGGFPQTPMAIKAHLST
ncbi:PfkB domain protein [Rhizobium sp. CF080]|uniref:PfkB family carbohydrate kinase n=1 Tax=Rhizobium sp. (strain CF080) TaxID=1144310 RepID=UPI0003047B9F|nr:PfkB family carbohydrate kinase [Rhizobium sp. CF080]EUB98923.1 PfkB domain protein [Rhizobium sp. CF080]